MIDADTILIKKLDFISNDRSKLFGTYYERHKPYWETLNTIFDYKIPFKSWVSTTCQINSLTPIENKALITILKEYIPRTNNISTPEWIANIIVTSVVWTHNKLDGCYFSEQDFIGYFLRYYFGTIPKKMLFLRSKVSYKLSNNQEKIASLIGFIHVTYEHWQIKNKNKSLPWINFIFILLLNLLLPYFKKLKLFLWEN